MTETILLTGATGYVGGRLAPRLLEAGFRVRCLVRSPRKLDQRSWAQDPRVEVVEGTLEDRDALTAAMRGCVTAYYLVHSMVRAKGDFADADRELAESFGQAARDASVSQIVYLGGLGEIGEGLSEHLSSRREVEAALRKATVPVTVLRAAMILGSGSASFEILRYLVERLPMMVTPRWVRTESQPIAITNVLEYLVGCAQDERLRGRTFDIGGSSVHTYRQLMQIMAEELGLPRRLIVAVPVLTPRLSSLWIHLVTPIDAALARPLAEGLRNRMVCREDSITRLQHQQLLTSREAIRTALQRTQDHEIETKWSDAGVVPGDPDWAGGRTFVDRRELEIDASPDSVYRAVCRVGGGHGWYSARWMWRLRGAMDRLVGGPGLRRGRRHPEQVSFGEALDFWRVIDVQPSRRLLLHAEMKLPGRATLEFEIEQRGDRSLLVQTARFAPRGLLGLLYWYSVLPLHGYVFASMQRGIRAAAMKIEASSSEASSTEAAAAAEVE